MRRKNRDARASCYTAPASEPPPLTGVINSNREGKAGLFVRIQHPEQQSVYLEFNFGEFNVSPNLAEAIADGFFATATGRSANTVRARFGNLRDGLLRHLIQLDRASALRLSDLTTPWFNDFLVFIGRKADGKFVLSVTTRLHQVAVVRDLLFYWKTTPPYEREISVDASIRSNPWPGASRGYKAAEPLSDAEWAKLTECMSTAMTQARSEFERAQRCMTEGVDKLANSKGRPDYSDYGTLLAAIDDIFDGVCPERKSLLPRFPDLWEAIPVHGYYKIQAAFFPSMSDLVPFVQHLAMKSGFNESVLLELKLSDIKREAILGVERISLRPFKSRAGKRQHRSWAVSDAPDSVSATIDFVLRWTKRARTIAPVEIQDRVFLFVSRNKGKRVVSQAFEPSIPSKKGIYATAVRHWSRRTGFPFAGFRRIRETVLDHVDRESGGDLRAIMAIGGQHSTAVIQRHYRSGGAFLREDARLAEVMEWRSRWIESGGKIDVRDEHVNRYHSAATPGWSCFDPYDSPIEGETKGRLCSAYGRCPTCPLAAVNRNDPYSLARLLQLRDAIDQLREQVAAQRWLAGWAPVLESLINHWLPLFSNETVLQSAASIDPPPLADLE